MPKTTTKKTATKKSSKKQDAVEKLAKTKIVKVVSYLNVTKKQLAEFMDTCYNTEIYGQKKFSEEDFVFAISKNDHHLLFMTYGIKDYLSEARYELEYKDIQSCIFQSSTFLFVSSKTNHFSYYCS